jgi:chromosome condensin MukBEF MukE localization factor
MAGQHCYLIDRIRSYGVCIEKGNDTIKTVKWDCLGDFGADVAGVAGADGGGAQARVAQRRRPI